MAKSKSSTDKSSTWNPINFNGMISRMNYLKFKCLQVSCIKKKELKIDTSDIQSKFKHAKIGYTVGKASVGVKNKRDQMFLQMSIELETEKENI